MPNVEFFRDCMEFIDEYAPRLYGDIEKHIQTKLTNSINQRLTDLETKQDQRLSTLEGKQNQKPQRQYSAVCRIQNHLSYKLGKAMIENSKSLFGYIKMPFVLWAIKKEHKLLERLSNSLFDLPKLETLIDYKEALKYKNHLSYKLGSALIKASKNWYKGGFIKLIFEINKMRKEHKK